MYPSVRRHLPDVVEWKKTSPGFGRDVVAATLLIAPPDAVLTDGTQGLGVAWPRSLPAFRGAETLVYSCSMRRVAVTGVGAVTPLGLDAPSTWRTALAGESGIDWIRAFDATGLPIRIAAEVKDFVPTDLISPKDVRRLERNVLFAVTASHEAVRDAGLEDFDPNRVGIIFGSAIGGLPGLLEQHDLLNERAPDRVSPSFLTHILVDTASGQIAISLGIK